MKKMMTILTALLMSVMLVVPVMAEEVHPPRMVDDADLLTLDEELMVQQELDRISEEYQFDVAVVTVDSLDGMTPQEFADDYYDYNGYGYGEDYDGAMLVISMEERDWYITTCGYGMAAIPESEIDDIGDVFVSYLSDGDYASGFLVFAECCESYLNYAEEYEEPGVHPMDIVKMILIAAAVGFGLAFIPMAMMKKEMKTVAPKAEAKDYLVPGSRQLRMSRDQFLYHTVTRSAKPKNTSSGGGHISSSGRSHGGGGGKF